MSKKPKNAAAPRVIEAWGRIERWLEQHARPIHKRLAKPASEKALGAAEKAMGLELPEGVRQLYLLHDGLKNGTMGLFEGWTWLPLSEVVSQWRDWQELLEENRDTWEGPAPEDADRGVRADNWNTKWIPITHSGSGDHHCVDLAPSKGGTSGQIIRMWHDTPERELKAKSIGEWLEALAGRLESGALVWSEEKEQLDEAPARPAPSPRAPRRSGGKVAKPEKRPAARSGRGAGSGTLQWTFQTRGAIKASPAIGRDGTLYVGSADKNLYAIKPDGQKAWAFATGAEVRSSPAIGSDGTVCVGSDDGNLYAVSPEGTKKWVFSTGSHVACRPVLGSEGMIFVTNSQRELIAVTPGGQKKWQIQTGDCGPAIGNDGTLYVGGEADEEGTGMFLHAISRAGKRLWKVPMGTFLTSAPSVGRDGTIYLGSFDGDVCAVAPDGQKRWAFQTLEPVNFSPALGSDGTVYVGSNDKFLYAIAPDGQKKWAFDVGGLVWSTPALGRDGTVYVGSRNKRFCAVAPDGTKKWVFIGGGEWCSPVVGEDGSIYAGNADGKLYALKP